MDQDHGHDSGMPGWDPNAFMANDSWDNQFMSSNLGFDQPNGGDHGFQNPEFLGSAPIHPQLSSASEFRDFDGYLPQHDQGNLWSNPSQTPAQYSQDSAIDPSFYQEQHQTHAPEANPTTNSRFALNIPQNNNFTSHLHGAGNQEAPHSLLNTPEPTQSSYSQSSMPSWQGQMQAGYASGNQYENPLAVSQAASLTPPVQTGSPSPYASTRNSVAQYQTEVPVHRQQHHPSIQQQHQPANSRSVHPQFAVGNNGQPQQQQLPIGQLPVSGVGSPHVSPQPQPAQKAMVHQMAQQVQRPQQMPQQMAQQVHHQMSRQISPHGSQQMPQQVSQQAAQQGAFPKQVERTQQQQNAPAKLSQPVPTQQPSNQPVVAYSPHPPQQVVPHHQLQQQQQQHQFVVQQAPSPQLSTISGQKRPFDAQPAPVIAAKKARIISVGPGLSSSSLPAQSQPLPFQSPVPVQPWPRNLEPVTPACTINFEDAKLLESARNQEQLKFPGVPNLIISSAPVKLKKSAPTKRYVTLTARPGKAPLFPEIPRGWIMAESLANHGDGYKNAKTDEDRYQADTRLDVEMNRAGNEMPLDWMKKVLKEHMGPSASLPAPPPEPKKTAINAVEKIRLHPDHLVNKTLFEKVNNEYHQYLLEIASSLRDTLNKMKSQPQTETRDPAALKSRLEQAIVAGLTYGHDQVLAELIGTAEKAYLAVVLCNLIIKFINASELDSPLTKAILKLFTRFTTMTMKMPAMAKMKQIKGVVEKKGDDETKALVARIFEIAESNKSESSDTESSADSDAHATGAKSSGVSKQKDVKKLVKGAAAPANSRATSATLGSDSKKVVPTTSTSKTAKPATDSKKLPTIMSSKTMGTDNTEVKKKAPSTSLPTGVKRSREDDAVAESRSSKKAATENSTSSSAGTKSAPSVLSGSKLAPSNKTVISKPSTAAVSSAAAPASQPKSRSALLLPGKTRPLAKPALAKPEPPRTVVKPVESKAPAAKVTKPKPAEAPKETSSSRSAFSALMDEIHQPKKVNTPVLPTKAAPEIPLNETPEERKRRLRKEERRALRLKVTFKPGDSLVQIREFAREPEEIDNNAKMAGGVNKYDEAESFRKVNSKLGIRAHEIEDRDWEAPAAIDFAHIPAEKRAESFETRGGLKTFETEEQRFIREHDRNELVVIYNHLNDIPPTPRSPQYEPSLGSIGPELHLPLSNPKYDEIRLRADECRKFGTRQASRFALGRLESKAQVERAQSKGKTPQQDPATFYNPATAASRDQRNYEVLTSDRLKNWRDPNPLPAPDSTKSPEEQLEVVLRTLAIMAKTNSAAVAAQKAQVTSPAPVQPIVAVGAVPVQASVSAQLTAPTPAQSAVPTPDYSAQWAQYYQQQAQQQQAWYGQQQGTAQPQAAQSFPASGQPQQQQAPDVAALLAQLGGQAAAPQTATQPQYGAVDQTAQLQAVVAALAANNQSQGPEMQAIMAAITANNQPQNAQYIADLMKWAQSQAGATKTTPAMAPTSAFGAASQPAYEAQSSYGQQQQQHQGGYESRSYSQPNQTRPGADFSASMYDDEGYVPPPANNTGRDNNNNNNGNYGRDRDRDWDNGRDGGGGRRNKKHKKHGGGGGGGGGHHDRDRDNSNNKDDVPDHLRNINTRLIGTKQCAFYAKGTCAKGDKCTFRHD
ncbi:hypothetical protein QBC40DRAFT_82619 [Triangularia verruculosa]|uniref:C3H1-type domain-containing protein n=1 Tax=Triangularia verruculosa TaxID=2587418 RepID=A0AAN6XFJ7_9PEZI|nr:hypothetical protein QBC40DRAFT_82619 [Triangularia verruculosa]